MAENDNVVKRIIPQSSLEVDVMTTNPVWGAGGVEINQNLKKQLKMLQKFINKDDVESDEEIDLWSLLGYFNRDIRLSNLTNMQEKQVTKSLILAGHFLERGYKENFVIELMKVASICETSQARGGFLRKRNNTLTREEFSNQEPEKKKIFAKNNSRNGGY